jgi:dipeptidyl aminopeptidase/acylaminoacyl peptidase
VPVLIIQTENDVRVKREQGDAMAEALRRAGKDVTYLLLPGEGHNVFAWSWAKRLKAFRKTEDFLARCLGGRSSGFDFYELGAWLF